jgi:hypothetical protein
MWREPVAVVDLVNPVRAGRGLVGGGREAGLDEARPLGGKPRTHTLDQHAVNLGGRGEESNRNAQPSLSESTRAIGSRNLRQSGNLVGVNEFGLCLVLGRRA